jgi:putative N6-adenine-specific DNA methylase
MYKCYASCAFGIEGVLAEEAKRLGLANVRSSDARVYFDADERGVAIANVFLRTADRVYIILGEFARKASRSCLKVFLI